MTGIVTGAPTRDGIELPFDQAPRVGFLEKLAGKRRVQRVAAAMRDEMADDRIPDERHVADDVENLVAHELVLEAQRVERAGLAEHDRVLERAAERQPVLPQHLDFLQEAERPRRRDLFDERLLGNLHRPASGAAASDGRS